MIYFVFSEKKLEVYKNNTLYGVIQNPFNIIKNSDNDGFFISLNTSNDKNFEDLFVNFYQINFSKNNPAINHADLDDFIKDFSLKIQKKIVNSVVPEKEVFLKKDFVLGENPVLNKLYHNTIGTGTLSSGTRYGWATSQTSQPIKNFLNYFGITDLQVLEILKYLDSVQIKFYLRDRRSLGSTRNHSSNYFSLKNLKSTELIDKLDSYSFRFRATFENNTIIIEDNHYNNVNYLSDYGSVYGISVKYSEIYSKKYKLFNNQYILTEEIDTEKLFLLVQNYEEGDRNKSNLGITTSLISIVNGNVRDTLSNPLSHFVRYVAINGSPNDAIGLESRAEDKFKDKYIKFDFGNPVFLRQVAFNWNNSGAAATLTVGLKIELQKLDNTWVITNEPVDYNNITPLNIARDAFSYVNEPPPLNTQKGTKYYGAVKSMKITFLTEVDRSDLQLKEILFKHL